MADSTKRQDREVASTAKQDKKGIPVQLLLGVRMGRGIAEVTVGTVARVLPHGCARQRQREQARRPESDTVQSQAPDLRCGEVLDV